MDVSAKGQNLDGKINSSRCKGRKTGGVKPTYKVRGNDEGEAQRRGWTFYEPSSFIPRIFKGEQDHEDFCRLSE
jgi:hypothetical protein